MRARLIIFLSLFFTFCVAQDRLVPKDVVEHVQKKYSGVIDASAAFVQKVTLRFGKNEQVQTGTVKIKKGNKYRVETTEQLLIANGKNVWIVSKANDQVLIDSFKENARVFSPDKFLYGLPHDFTASELTESNSIIKLSLEPKSVNAQTRQVKSLTAWVRRGDWTVERIVYIDRNQATYDISLTNIRFNAQIGDKEFEFEPSEGMKIVDLRKVQ